MALQKRPPNPVLETGVELTAGIRGEGYGRTESNCPIPAEMIREAFLEEAALEMNLARQVGLNQAITVWSQY